MGSGQGERYNVGRQIGSGRSIMRSARHLAGQNVLDDSSHGRLPDRPTAATMDTLLI